MSTNLVIAFSVANVTLDTGTHKRLSFGATALTPSATFHYSAEHIIACSATDITGLFSSSDDFTYSAGAATPSTMFGSYFIAVLRWMMEYVNPLSFQSFSTSDDC
jgi:hypothetical protein